MRRDKQIRKRVVRNGILIAKSLLILLLLFYLYQLYLEAGLPMAMAVIVIIAWQLYPVVFRRITIAFARLAHHRLIAAAIVGLFAFTISAVLSLTGPLPQPRVHDEFSYLLAADTFARGRLTNPTHPLWKHFETFYTIHQPSYASNYPPGQGLMLAVGQVLTGYPIVGAWLGVALGCAAVYWMLMAWLPLRWALLGGLLAALHPLILGWGQNYWGGAVAMGGGALVLGAFRRLWRGASTRNAVILGLGMGVLAVTRPYEGAVLSGVLMLILLGKVARESSPRIVTYVSRAGIPLSAVLALIALAMGLYNLKVTGNAFRMPVSIIAATYSIAPPFLWQEPNPEPVYNHPEIRRLYTDWSLPEYESQRATLHGLLSATTAKALMYADKYLQGWIVSLLLFVALGLRNRVVALISLVLLVFMLALLVETWHQPHYAAPAAALLFCLVLQSCRKLASFKFVGIDIGRPLARGFLILFAATLLTADLKLLRPSPEGWHYKRAQIVKRLNQGEDKHLVVVRYGPYHSPHDEWVYNQADIDGAKVVWAREMGRKDNEKLLNYFQERVVWLLEPDVPDPVLLPYP
jgi:hypothetical protein